MPDQADGLREADIRAVLAWLWRPFQSRTEALKDEIHRADQAGEIYATAVLKISEPKGMSRDAWLQALTDQILAGGHRGTIDLHGGIERLLHAIKAWLPDFQFEKPSWTEIEKVLRTHCRVEAADLRAMTLLEITRLLEEGRQRSKQGSAVPARTQQKKRRVMPLRSITPFEQECWKRREAGATFKQIADQMKRKRQTVDKAYRRAVKKLRAIGGHRVGGSIAAQTNVEGLEGRARSRHQ